MELTREQKIGAGFVGGAAILAYVGLRKRVEEKQIACDRISNRVGGTMSNLCPTGGVPYDFCTREDFDAWRERLSIQMAAVTRLQSNMDDVGVLDLSFYDAIKLYLGTSAKLISDWGPAWTTETDIAPVTTLLRTGCDIMNQGNRALVAAKHPELVVEEPYEVETFQETAETKKTIIPNWMKWVGIAGAGALVVIAVKS